MKTWVSIYVYDVRLGGGESKASPEIVSEVADLQTKQVTRFSIVWKSRITKNSHKKGLTANGCIYFELSFYFWPHKPSSTCWHACEDKKSWKLANMLIRGVCDVQVGCRADKAQLVKLEKLPLWSQTNFHPLLYFLYGVSHCELHFLWKTVFPSQSFLSQSPT